MSDSKCDYTSKFHDGKTLIFKTESEIVNYSIQWEISNFYSIIKACGEFIKTGEFYTGTNEKKKWRLKVYPNGDGTAGHVAVFLWSESKVDACAVSFSILGIGGTEHNPVSAAMKMMPAGTDWGFSRFIGRDKLLVDESTLLPGGTLTILCKLQVLEALEDSSSNRKVNTVDDLLVDFEKLLTSSEWSDVTISVGEKKFPVHKSILASRSPVFGAMLRNDLEESRSNIVEITDTEPDVMEEVLLYIYTGKCGRIHEMAAELIQVAEKYDLPGLKDLCEEALIEQLDVENAANIILTADMYNRKQLKSKALNFIIKNGNEVLKSSSWKKMVAAHPTLEVEVLRGMVNNFYI